MVRSLGGGGIFLAILLLARFRTVAAAFDFAVAVETLEVIDLRFTSNVYHGRDLITFQEIAYAIVVGIGVSPQRMIGFAAWILLLPSDWFYYYVVVLFHCWRQIFSFCELNETLSTHSTQEFELKKPG